MGPRYTSAQYGCEPTTEKLNLLKHYFVSASMLCVYTSSSRQESLQISACLVRQTGRPLLSVVNLAAASLSLPVSLTPFSLSKHFRSVRLCKPC